MRREFFILVSILVVLEIFLAFYAPLWLWNLIIVGPIVGLGIMDVVQTKHSIRSNFPVLGRFRYLFEMIRPEINQYFIESDSDGRPFNREERSVIYQRAKNELDTQPFGTKLDVYQVGYEWINHSFAPKRLNPEDMRVTIGGPDCRIPYSASIFNISAMSYGALGSHAIQALNWGANLGEFAHNTGEGSISPYHEKYEGDLIWQIGTGYFGCRNSVGEFCRDQFRQKAQKEQVKMIELKLSQGAKPGHGGILPAVKISEEISKIRGIPKDQDAISPPSHRELRTPKELVRFIKQLRDLSGGKPVGIKLCLGKRREFLSICKAMHNLNITPDFITVDGSEGGTGAAPLEFANHMGTPGTDALVFVHNALTGFNLRKDIKIFYSGKVSTGFGLLKYLCLGADAIYSARSMMMALGCIQALRCNSNQCPAGVATTDPYLDKGLNIENKAKRVANFHSETVASTAYFIGAAGVSSAEDLRPWHLMRRTSLASYKHYGELYQYLQPGDLLGKSLPQSFQRPMDMSSAETFAAAST